MRKKCTCEFCLSSFISTEHNTVCGQCDSKMEREQTKEIDVRAARYAEKYKCKICQTGLPETRALHCEKCSPNDFRPSDDYMNMYVYYNSKERISTTRRVSE